MLIKWYCRYVDPEWRFIPTRVGYTILYVSELWDGKVHPHSRGVYDYDG